MTIRFWKAFESITQMESIRGFAPLHELLVHFKFYHSIYLQVEFTHIRVNSTCVFEDFCAIFKDIRFSVSFTWI